MPEEKAFQVRNPEKEIPNLYEDSKNPIYLDPNANEADMVGLSVPDAALRLHGGDGPAVIIEANGEEIDLVKYIKTTRVLVWCILGAVIPLALAVVLMSFQLS